MIKIIPNLSQNRKIVSIIILCLMLFSTLPLSFLTTGGGNEKTAKSPKSPGSNGELSELTNGTGASANDNFGWNVSGAGDVNGDGIDDIVVGAPYAAAGGSERGAVYIFFGYSDINTGNISAEYANVTINGTTDNAHFGWSVGHGKFDEAPDNGGGKKCAAGRFPKLGGAKGAPYYIYGYVYYPNGGVVANKPVTITNVTGEQSVSTTTDAEGYYQYDIGTTWNSATGDEIRVNVSKGYYHGLNTVYVDRSGSSSSCDVTLVLGYDDLIIGEPDNGNGKAYLFFGRATADWSSLYTTANANVTLTGEGTGDRFGFSVSGAGDVNNDNYDDVIIGAYANGTDRGKAYIYYGRSSWAGIYVHPDASADEVITEGDSAGGSYTDTQADEGVTRNITEASASATNTYDYNDYVTAGHTAYNTGTAGADGMPPLEGPAVTGEAEIADYTTIQTDDTSYSTTDSKVDAATHRFQFKIAEAETDVTGIYIEWIGDYEQDDPNTLDMYIWDYTNTQWDLLVDDYTIAATDTTVTATITTTITDYIDPSGYMSWIIQRPDPGAVARMVDTDYVKVRITYSSYSLNVSYVLDNIGSYSSYTIEFQATALNTTTNSNENFTVQYSVDGGAWNALGVGYILNGTSEQTLSETTYAVPSINVTVRITDNTTGATPNNNTIRIDFIELYGTGMLTDVTLTGENDNDKFGYSVSDAGNVNNDDYDDVIVGAPGYNSSRGKAYVFYGYTGMGAGGATKTIFSDGFESGGFTTGGWTISTDAQVTTTNVKTGTYSADLGAGNTITINNITKTLNTTGYVNIKLYYSVATAGLDAGVDYFKADASVLPNISGSWVENPIAYTDYSFDLPSEAANNPKLSVKFYLYRSATGEFAYVDDVSVTGTPAANVTLTGNATGDQFGYSVAGADNVSGDGYDDVIVGAPCTANGSAYVIYGSSAMVNVGGWGASAVQMEHLDDDGSGYYVDVNRWQAQSFTPSVDFKITKVVVGTWDGGTRNTPTTAICEDDGTGLPDTSQVLTSANVAFGIHGDWFEVVFATQPTLSAGTTYWIVIEDNSAAAAGQLWLYKGSDVYSGGYRAYQSSGVWTKATTEDFCFGVCGQPACATPNVTLTGATAGDQFGYSVSGAGDINNDGYNDTIVGAPYNDTVYSSRTDAGAIYVFNGSSSMPNSISALNANYTNYGETANDNFGFSVSDAGDVNNDNYNDTIVGAPYYGSNDNGKAYVLTCRKAILTVSNWTDKASETPTAAPGTNDILMLNMTLTASECTITITKLRVDLTGTNADSDVSACRLFHDANDNGAYDSGTDVFLGNQTFSGGSLNFTLSFDVAYGTPEKLLLLFNISSGATPDNTVGARLSSASYISVARPDEVSSTNFPLQSTNIVIQTVGDKLTVIGISMAPGFVNQGATNRTMLNLTFNSSNEVDGQITITSINISLTGTGIGAGDNANVSEVTLYNDSDGSGDLSAGDEQLNTTQTFVDGYVVFGNLDFAVYYSSGNCTVFVVYNISSSATIDATVGANVTSKTKITVDSPDGVNTFSTIWSDNSTIIEPANINYTIRNETGVLQEGTWKLWGNWTADPGDEKVNGTNWLRIRNTNGSNPNQEFVIDFTQGNFTNTTKDWNISINGNIWFWYFYTNISSETPDHWIITETNATTGVNETDYLGANGAHNFTFNKVGEYIWILYRIENLPEICPGGDYTASFTMTVV